MSDWRKYPNRRRHLDRPVVIETTADPRTANLMISRDLCPSQCGPLNTEGRCIRCDFQLYVSPPITTSPLGGLGFYRRPTKAVRRNVEVTSW